MEEDIKMLEDFIHYLKTDGEYQYTVEINAIEHLISAYKKLEEENKEYRKINSIVNKISSKDIEKVIKEFNNDYIPKQKIKDIVNALDRRVLELEKTNRYGRLTLGDALKIKSFLQHEILRNL